MTRIHSTRDALLAQVFDDLDGMVDKMQAVQKTALESGRQLQATTAMLDDAADCFRMAVTLFTEQAKAELSDHMDRSVKMVLTQKADEIQVAMQKAARTAFEAQSWDTAGALADRLKGAASEIRRRIDLGPVDRERRGRASDRHPGLGANLWADCTLGTAACLAAGSEDLFGRRAEAA